MGSNERNDDLGIILRALRKSRTHVSDEPHKNGLVTLARKIIGLKPMRFSTGNHGASRLASLRWKPGSIYLFYETEMIEFMEHVLAF